MRNESEIIKLKSMRQGRATKTFKTREVITGSKKAGKEAHAILDPKTNKMVVANAEIKKVTLKYCLSVLENNKPEDNVKNLVELKERVHQLGWRTKIMMKLMNYQKLISSTPW